MTQQENSTDVRERRGYRAPKEGIRQLKNPLGEEMRIIVRGEDEGGDYDILHFTTPPGVAVPRHIHHDHDEGLYILKGALTTEVAGERTLLTEGMFGLNPRGVPHTYRNSGDESAEYLLLLTPAGHVAFFEETAAIEQPPGPPDPDELMKQVGPLFEKHNIEAAGPPLEA